MKAEQKTPTILCIEDEQALREDIREELEDFGFEVHEAVDGKDGLAKILEIKPDIVLSDITMPNMTGHELVTELRAEHAEFAEMPFVFLSALAEKQHLLQGMKAGADDYLTKPVDYDMLLTKITTRLRQKDRMNDKKKAEHIKIYRALTAEKAEAQSEPEPEPFSWHAEEPKVVAMVGESSDSLLQMQNLFHNAGHKVTIFTSGRSYLTKASALKPDLTCFWVQTDDMNANGATKFLESVNPKNILVVTPQTKAKVSTLDTNIFHEVINLPLSDEEIVKAVTPYI